MFIPSVCPALCSSHIDPQQVREQFIYGKSAPCSEASAACARVSIIFPTALESSTKYLLASSQIDHIYLSKTPNFCATLFQTCTGVFQIFEGYAKLLSPYSHLGSANWKLAHKFWITPQRVRIPPKMYGNGWHTSLKYGVLFVIWLDWVAPMIVNVNWYIVLTHNFTILSVQCILEIE